MGRRTRASHIGRGIRMVSVKHDVGSGEERFECGPYYTVSSPHLPLPILTMTYEAFWSIATESHLFVLKSKQLRGW